MKEKHSAREQVKKKEERIEIQIKITLQSAKHTMGSPTKRKHET